ncbi:hypothetical protein POVWA2_082680 [Plasmodium ovale wallikeri]|uniref:Secreted protein n=1 Tax=Plasmodium ovale wallikeri TaxID=864142 RepID=A0A1A9AMU6_PLAOA|nr:hypothetical protein POVWA2_082680 [Plasmodium ovale wallikeri]
MRVAGLLFYPLWRTVVCKILSAPRVRENRGFSRGAFQRVLFNGYFSTGPSQRGLLNGDFSTGPSQRGLLNRAARWRDTLEGGTSRHSYFPCFSAPRRGSMSQLLAPTNTART